MTRKEYVDTFRKNRILADRELLGKKIRFTAEFIGSINNAHFDGNCDYSIMVRSSTDKDFAWIYLNILSTYNDILSTLKEGDKLIMEGQAYSDVTITGCSILQILN